MRHILAGLAIAAVLGGSVSAQAEKRIFIIANNADGYGVDRCLATGATCGVAVATAYCKSRDFALGLVPQDRSRRDHRRGALEQRVLPRRLLRRVRRHRVHALSAGSAGLDDRKFAYLSRP